MKFKLIFVIDVEKGEAESPEENANYLLEDLKTIVQNNLDLETEDLVSCHVEKE